MDPYSSPYISPIRVVVAVCLSIHSFPTTTSLLLWVGCQFISKHILQSKLEPSGRPFMNRIASVGMPLYIYEVFQGGHQERALLI